MRRAGFAVILLFLALGGCASVLGLEDRTLEEGAVPGDDDDDGGHGKSSSSSSSSSSSGGSSSTSSSSSGDPDAGFVACSPAGPIVYQFTKLTDPDTLYRYQTSEDPIDDFANETPLFRLAVDGSPNATQPLYLLKDGTSGDYLVSPITSEGAYANVPPPLGASYDKAYPGTIPVYRHVHQATTPLRHRLDLEADAGAYWESDKKTYYVCPL
jgi:hypothetical protein